MNGATPSRRLSSSNTPVKQHTHFVMNCMDVHMLNANKNGMMTLHCRTVDEELAALLREFRSPSDNETRMFYEVVIAPGYTPEGLAKLKGKSKTLRILEAKPRAPEGQSLRQVAGGTTSHCLLPSLPPAFQCLPPCLLLPTQSLPPRFSASAFCCAHIPPLLPFIAYLSHAIAIRA